MHARSAGGRDRPKDDGTYKPDAFDPASVELMRNLLSRAKQPGHLLTMAMFSAPLMPPPNKVEKAVGERRITNWTPVGISLGPELDVAAITAGIEDKEAAQLKLANAAFDAVATVRGRCLAP